MAIFYTALIVASLCLLHFRVAAFLFPLLLIIFLIELFRNSNRMKNHWTLFFQSALIVLLVFIIVLPTLIPGMQAYWDARVPHIDSDSEIPAQKLSDDWYYAKGDTKTNQLSADSIWLYLICVTGVLIGLFRPNSKQISLLIIFWSLFFAAFMYAYLTNIPLLVIMNRTAVLLALYLPMSIGMGLIVFVLEDHSLAAMKRFAVLPLVMVLLGGLLSIKSRLTDYWPEQEFMTKADLKAMEWIKQNTPQEAVFGANTGFLGFTKPYGTDAGYWIPYYGERETTTLTLLNSLSDDRESSDVLRAHVLKELYSSPDTLEKLCAFNVSYLYSGAKPPVSINDFDFTKLLKQPRTSLVYDEDGVQILEICK
jgi:hypothetical protein